jgi:hypothetical protein
MTTEPSFLRSVSNSTVCTWFFILACVNSLVALSILVLIVFTLQQKTPLPNTLALITSGTVALINGWFLFLMCNRSIGKESFAMADDEYSRVIGKY